MALMLCMTLEEILKSSDEIAPKGVMSVKIIKNSTTLVVCSF